jgi:protoporphyrinogen oxidase
MGYVSGGYKTVFDRLGKLLRKSKSDIILNTSVSSITPDPAGGLRLSHGGREEHFDKVIFTAPLRVLEKVVSPELITISNNRQPIEYLGVICLVLITPRPLTPYYVLNIADEKVPFTGVIGMSSLVDLDQTAGYHLTYFPKYVGPDDPYWQRSDEELKKLFIAGVQYLYPDFKESEIKASHLNKAMNVQPLQVMNYSEMIPDVATKHPDLYVLNTSQFVNNTLNNNSVVKHIEGFMAEFSKEQFTHPSPNTVEENE